MGRTAFRTPQRIFATLGVDGDEANLKLALEQQELLSAARPLAFAPVSGGWGKMGWTRVSLKDADEVDITAALAGAHAIATVKTTPRKRRQ